MTKRSRRFRKIEGKERTKKRATQTASAHCVRISNLIDGQRIERIQINQLRPNVGGNPHTHSNRQLKLIAQSIKQFGFINPILIDSSNVVIAGAGRIKAAEQLGLSVVPALRIRHLSAAAMRAYHLADNRLAELAGWDKDTLMIELQALIGIG